MRRLGRGLGLIGGWRRSRSGRRNDGASVVLSVGPDIRMGVGREINRRPFVGLGQLFRAGRPGAAGRPENRPGQRVAEADAKQDCDSTNDGGGSAPVCRKSHRSQQAVRQCDQRVEDGTQRLTERGGRLDLSLLILVRGLRRRGPAAGRTFVGLFGVEDVAFDAADHAAHVTATT